MLTIQELHDRAGNPELSHWNAADTFTIMEVAILSAGADPLEYEDVNRLRRGNHINWRHAMLFLRSLVEGICSGEVGCIEVYITEWDGYGNSLPKKIDQMSLSQGLVEEVDVDRTRINRKALSDWYKRKKLARPSPLITVTPVIEISSGDAPLRQLPALTGPSFLDPSNPLSPREVRVGVEAWEAITAAGDPRQRGVAVVTALKQYLQENRDRLGIGKEAIDRISTVFNWNKSGGAPKTPT